MNGGCERKGRGGQVLPGVVGARRGGMDLNQPRLQLIVDHDVIPVHLEAMLVVDHHFLDGEE